MNRGILYIGHGERYMNEIALSAESVKKVCGNVDITVFTDVPFDCEYVDHVRIVSIQGARAKVYLIHESPYDQTIYLDSDVIAVRDFTDIFDLLGSGKYDIVFTHDLARKRIKFSAPMPEYGKIPYAFSEVNGGIMGFNRCEKVDEFFSFWRHYHTKYYNVCPWDQPSLRISLWESGARVYILPIEYNIRSQANREKQIRFHHEFGDEHLAPKMYHMHHGGKNLQTATEFCKANAQPY